MDYERIQKPQSGGGFSPGKLRNMLMGVEKKRKDEDELDSTFTSRSHISDNDESVLEGFGISPSPRPGHGLGLYEHLLGTYEIAYQKSPSDGRGDRTHDPRA
ncbi:hypothetical protein QN277_011770 [Acacia crassicarpa]|uniref:Uncharacterized protein n=1 Tax=Acacia crassicarpa TaxID=499986 RepID=A0AAE1TD35_9FABA|nr:hypothetical protein QN277_011770 [Acacia crassicarpa]